MKHKAIMSLVLAALLALSCAGCSLADAGDLVAQAEQMLDGIFSQAQQVLEQAEQAEQADGTAPAPVEEAPVTAEETAPAPAEEAPVTTEETVPAPAEEAPAATETAAPEPTQAPQEAAAPGPPRPGKYKGGDGSVLTVKDDGSCTFKTRIEVTVNGEKMADTVTFHGPVSDGSFTFTKVTYYGMDITDMARDAGYADASQWEAQAAALYGK